MWSVDCALITHELFACLTVIDEWWFVVNAVASILIVCTLLLGELLILMIGRHWPKISLIFTCRSISLILFIFLISVISPFLTVTYPYSLTLTCPIWHRRLSSCSLSFSIFMPFSNLFYKFKFPLSFELYKIYSSSILSWFY